MHPDVWVPAQYDRFKRERSEPFFDLVALVHRRPGMRIIDLGCGTGELTRTLHRRLKARHTTGLDSSGAMLARSRAFAHDHLRFEQGDIAHFAAAGAYDLVFSNAALHWVPDHEGLFTRLTQALAADGQLAVQMPANESHPSHRIADELAQEPPFREALGTYRRTHNVLAAEQYAALLDRLGYREQHVRLQVYAHHLQSRDEVVEWVRGTLLTDYERRLPAELYAVFVEQYRQRLLPELEDARPYFYPFNRLLLWGAR